MHDTQDHRDDPTRSRWQRMVHRWLIQYNPLYLVSAALVLIGVILLSRSLAGSGGALGQIGITAIAELYAWALIAGAALLTRIHLRRPAVMLALLAALYQCDLTLHTETCAHLGWLGLLGTGGWVVLFVAKLSAIAWALRLRLSASAATVPILGALGISLIPWFFRELDAHVVTSLVGAWMFALFALGLWSSRRVLSVVALDGWALTVTRRSLRATWLGWAAMVLVHVLFWCVQHPNIVQVRVLIPVGLLLATRVVMRETKVWALVSATLVYVGVAMPEFFALTACMAAVVLGLRALRYPNVVARTASTLASLGPYRDDAGGSPPLPAMPPAIAFALAHRSAMLRLLAGAVGCLYLALWTHAWSGGPWPEHVWWIDLLLAATTVVWAKALRDRIPLVMPVATALHCAVQLHLVPTPSSVAQWGMTCVGVGFALLLLSLGASVRWRGSPPSG